MDTDQILLIMGLTLLLFFILRHAHYTSVYTLTPATTKTATVVYRTPQVNSIYLTPGHYNAYKSQFYN